MSNRKRIFILGIAIGILTVSILAYLLLCQHMAPTRSLLIYRNYLSRDAITNWIVDMNTGETWEVGKGLAAWHWSPSGKHIAFHTLTPLPYEIWVSDPVGNNLRRVFDSREHPDLEVKEYTWLTDRKIIVNAVKDAQQFGYLLDVDTLAFEQIPSSTGFVQVSPSGKFWLEFEMEDGYSLFDLDEKRTPLPGMDLLGYSFSPDGDQVVYSCAGTYKYSSLCLADISISGITNERKTAEDVLLDAFGESMWSKDERYVGFFAVLNGTKSFRAVDVSTGAIAYEWPYPSKTVLVGWSPSGDKIIDYDGFILDLNTGQTSNLFQGNPTPYGVMDWRSIKIP